LRSVLGVKSIFSLNTTEIIRFVNSDGPPGFAVGAARPRTLCLNQSASDPGGCPMPHAGTVRRVCENQEVWYEER
jgi:hypothetical protein